MYEYTVDLSQFSPGIAKAYVDKLEEIAEHFNLKAGKPFVYSMIASVEQLSAIKLSFPDLIKFIS